MSAETLPLTATPIPCYESVAEQQAAGARKSIGDSPTYIRYGSDTHAELEDRVAELAGAQPEETLIFNTGMSAIEAAIKTGIEQAYPQSPRLAQATALYPGTTTWLNSEWRVRGLESIGFDAGDSNGVERAIASFQPSIIFSETVGNYVGAPVLDVHKLLEYVRAQKKQPLVIIDNTLPLSSGYNVYDATTPEDNVCFVESGTKAYALNHDGLGLAYSKNPAVISGLRNQRNTGGLPGIGTARHILEILPTKDQFDARNLQIFAKTGELARKLYETSLAADTRFTVDHPSIPTHANYGQDHVGNNGDITPVVFLSPASSEAISMLEFGKRIGDDPAVQVHLPIRDSFGFDEGAFYLNGNHSSVRLAVGVDTDVDALGDALYSALTK